MEHRGTGPVDSPYHRRPPPPPPPVYPAALPMGWTEHRAPGGQVYWYNVHTGQSTWQRPVMPPMPPIPQPAVPAVAAVPAATAAATEQSVQPKQKKQRIKVEGTTWMIVKTEDGMEFYYNKETKQSVWEMPKELEEALENQKKRKLEEETETENMEAKRQKAEEQETGQEQAVDGAGEATEMTEEDIAWQLQNMDPEEMAELGLATTAVTDEVQVQEDQGFKGPETVTGAAPVPGSEVSSLPKMPPAPSATAPAPQIAAGNELSEEERIEQFTQMLAEKDISPYGTWEKELPKIITDERYTLVQSHSKRKNLFNNYCRVLVQQLKANKPRTKTPEEAYTSLLEEEASMEMYWEDFRRKVKNDARFKGLRDPKQREMMFKDYIKQLRKGRGKKEEAYMALLRETKEIHVGMRWRDAKKILEEDERYQALQPKTLREDLFRDYLDHLGTRSDVI
ncbi:hypothetical protein EC973_009456 [Apophysomyces ossiformis]|uniref:Transcription elongation regulator 1 n=1 Tax=Apophysomyces ossiformis TaxID=679940 RepID=A0A8H7BSD0_9FUNG|nr:hypothetical protein EC973_009456 [Apophysomyces ossiformis]